MSGVGLALINKVIDEGLPVTFFSDNDIDSETFRDADERAAFEFIMEHAIEYGQFPTTDTIEIEVDDIVFGSYPNEPVGFFVDRFKRRNALQTITDTMGEVAKCVDDSDVETAKEVIKGLALELERRHSTDKIVRLEDVVPEVIADHNLRQQRGRMKGVPFGIEFIDQVSDGAQAADTVAVVGRPGVGKTYILLNGANAAYDAGETPLFATYEMATKQCSRRLIALRTNVSATDIRLGRLSHWATRRLGRGVHSITEEESGRPFYLLQGSLQSTVEDLALRVKEYRPSVLYVDGAYLIRTRMKTKSRWEMVTDAAEWLKDIAMENNIPVIASYQFNRRGSGSLGNIGYSDAIGQLASIVIGISNEAEVGDGYMLESQLFKLLELLKGREGEKGTVRVRYDMARMIIRQDTLLSGFNFLDPYMQPDPDRIPARIGNPGDYEGIGIVLPNSRLFGGDHCADGECWWE